MAMYGTVFELVFGVLRAVRGCFKGLFYLFYVSFLVYRLAVRVHLE